MSDIILKSLGFQNGVKDVKIALLKSEVGATETKVNKRNLKGALQDRYNIYLDCLSEGETPKTFDEWLNS